MAKRIPNISDAEWVVMEVVWAQGEPVAANEVVARLEKSTDWKDKTIKTMLNRLVNKGALGYEPDGKRYLYKPRVARDECVRVQSQSLVSRLFGGATGAA